MKTVWSVFGPPCSGQSTLLADYQDRVVYVGAFIRSLAEDDDLRKRCYALFSENKPITTKIIHELFGRMEFPDQNVLLFDGTPRSVEQFEGLSSQFCFKAGLEVVVDEKTWLDRIQQTGITRPARLDSSYDVLVQRREAYLASIESLRSCFPEWVVVNNSGDIAKSQKEFKGVLDSLIEE